MGLQNRTQLWSRLSPLLTKRTFLALLSLVTLIISLLFLYKRESLLFNGFRFAHSPKTYPWAPPWGKDGAAAPNHDTSEITPPKLPHIQSLGSETQSTQGLPLRCHSSCGNSEKSVCGGVTYARSSLQTLLRWAIDAGAVENSLSRTSWATRPPAASPGDWDSIEVHVRLYAEYIDEIREPQEGSFIRDVYVSFGDNDAIKRIRIYLASRGLTAHDKLSLQDNDEDLKGKLEGLGFDQKRAVHSSPFVNVWIGATGVPPVISTRAAGSQLAREEDFPPSSPIVAFPTYKRQVLQSE